MAVAEDSDQEKSLPASQRRIEQAREEGQIARSRELVTASVALASAGTLWWGGKIMVEQGQLLLREALHFEARQVLDSSTMVKLSLTQLMHGLQALSPLFIAVVVAAIFGSIAIGGWNFTTQALTPKLTRLSPMNGLGQIFSWNGVGELVKAILKAVLLGGVGLWLVMRNQASFVGLLQQAPQASLHYFMQLMLTEFLILSGLLVFVAALDVPFQIWRHMQQLRMTTEEMRREMKETEGDPHIKARIRSQQREIARRRMMEAVPQADVIVTNPTHYAVALKYDEQAMGAPKLVAKGSDLLAQRIRELAAEHGVPVVEAPPLARALYFHTELEQMVPMTLYGAVAQVLAYVYQLRAWQEYGGALPYLPDDLPVPTGMDVHPTAIPNTATEAT